MKRYSAAQARARLADLLNDAERGTPITIERRGVRYVLRVDRKPVRRRATRSLIEVLDPAVERGEWTWTMGARGLRFTARRRRT